MQVSLWCNNNRFPPSRAYINIFICCHEGGLFNEDRLLMDLRSIQKELQQMLCPKHGQLPDISILGDRLHIRCCCEEFRGDVMRKSESLMYHALRDDIAKDVMRIMKGKG